jgi:hypothetical protein
MARTGGERRGGRTVLPTDIFLFAFLAMSASAGSSMVADNKASVVILTIAWMSAAITRLGELRRGERPALQLHRMNLRTTAMLVVGTGPWIMVGFLQRVYPSLTIWKPFEVPPSLRAFGISLAMAVIAEPFLQRARRYQSATPADRLDGSTRDEYRFSEAVAIRSGAILLLSGSPVFALLCALWLGATLWHPHTPLPNRSPLPISP